ncbi:MAG TPA: aspartate aminotransferase family protein [Longimicrobiales bacterium]|nr:aspartate aminotransferase family protein [Longimicrobiales bacterium]
MATTISLTDEVRAAHDEFVFPALRPYYRDPIVIAQASGVTVTDTDGIEYLDAFAGILTTSLGHCHSDVVQRVQDQVARLGHTSALYLTEQHVGAARRLAGITPGRLRRSFFVNSGTEAIETAIMMACSFTGRSEIVALRYAYAGRSLLASEITAQSAWRPVPTMVAGVRHALAPYLYRSPFGNVTEEQAAELYARDVEEVIMTTTNGRPAAFIAETIQGVAGYIVPPRGYFQRVAEIIRGVGGVLIIDEVQAGFGRTGGKWFGIEHWDVEPDIMVMAKGIANGFPVGVAVCTDEIGAAWKAKTISTFGGNAVSMAAVDATLEVMMREDVPARAAARGAQLRAGLDALAQRHSWIGDVRGMGLMQALELVDDRTSKTPSPRRAQALLEATKAERLLVGIGGMHGHVIRFGPSLLITASEIDDVLARLTRACDHVARSTP